MTTSVLMSTSLKIAKNYKFITLFHDFFCPGRELTPIAVKIVQELVFAQFDKCS